MHFPQGPLKTSILDANRFLHVLQKKSRNKLSVRPHDTYFMFATFFSHVNNKRIFFQVGIPLIKNIFFQLLLRSTAAAVKSGYLLSVQIFIMVRY